MADNKETKQVTYNSSVEEDILSEDVDVLDNTLKVNSMEDATRYAYGLSETRKSIAELEEIAKKEIDKWEGKINEVREWLDGVTTPLRNKEDYLANQLQVFHFNQFLTAKDEKEQKKLTSIKLPYSVTLASRAQQPKYEVVDEVRYRKYAEDNKYIKAPKPADVDWASLKSATVINKDGRLLNKDTGEFLDFIKVVPQERKFEVK